MLTLVLLGGLFAGCAMDGGFMEADEPVDYGSGPPEIVQARQELKRELQLTPYVKHVTFHLTPGDVREIDYIDPTDGNKADVINIATIIPSSIVKSYSPGSQVTYAAWKVSYMSYVDMHQLFWLTSSWSEDDADRVVRDLKILVLDARQDLDAQVAENLEKFKQKAADWRAQAEKPPMPDEAHTHQVLAENAIEEKNLDKAEDEYLAALKIYPCWPEGQFNVASILGETGYYTGAIAHMREYLELVPDAPDAQDAKNKIIIWQDKMGN